MKSFSINCLAAITLLSAISTPAIAVPVYDVQGRGSGNNQTPRFEINFDIRATVGSTAGRLFFSRVLSRNEPPDVDKIDANLPLNAQGIKYDQATGKFTIQETQATQYFNNTERKGCLYAGTMTVELTDGKNDPKGDIFSVKFTPNSRAAQTKGCPPPKSVSWRARLATGPGISIRKLR